MSNDADKQHPWAKFNAPPTAPRAPSAPQVPPTAPAPPSAPAPLARGSAPATPPPQGSAPATPPAPMAFPKRVIAPSALPVRAIKPREDDAIAEPALQKDWAAPRDPSTAKSRAPFGPDEALVDAAARAVDEDVSAEGQKRSRAAASAFRRAVEATRKASQRGVGVTLGAWWRDWRRSSSAKVLAAFVVLYGVLAVVRRPNDAAVEETRHAQEQAALETLLKSYIAAGGTVLAEKPHGGAELYPRGILLQDEVLAAFRRAPTGETFSVLVKDPMWNPIAALYGYPPVYVGGTYFHLERKFNLRLYRFSFLIRKDSEKQGTLLLAKVELEF